MNQKELLKLFDGIEDSYVVDAAKAPEIKIVRKRPMMSSAAAVIAIVCLLLGCSTAYAYTTGFFGDYFSSKNREPLTQEQLQVLESQEVAVGQSVSQNGWTVELGSVISDGNVGYVLLHITAPEGIDFEKEYLEKSETFQIKPGNYITADNFLTVSGLSFSGSYQVSWADDGDGLQNTGNMVLRIVPMQDLKEPFGPDVNWHIRIEDLVCTDGSLNRGETLTEGTWEFDVNFAKDGTQNPWIELLKEPLVTKVYLLRPSSMDPSQKELVQEDLTVTSIKINALSVSISFEYEDYVSFLSDLSDQNRVHLVMEDGSQIEFKSQTGIQGYVLLVAREPIVLEQAMYLVLADGIKIPIPKNG